MTLYQYNQLTRLEQFENLWKKGVFLTNRIELPFKYALYQIDSFYVEVRYDSKENVLMGLRTFSTTNPLEPYLEQIKILL